MGRNFAVAQGATDYSTMVKSCSCAARGLFLLFPPTVISQKESDQKREGKKTVVVGRGGEEEGGNICCFLQRSGRGPPSPPPSYFPSPRHSRRPQSPRVFFFSFQPFAERRRKRCLCKTCELYNFPFPPSSKHVYF